MVQAAQRTVETGRGPSSSAGISNRLRGHRNLAIPHTIVTPTDQAGPIEQSLGPVPSTSLTDHRPVPSPNHIDQSHQPIPSTSLIGHQPIPSTSLIGHQPITSTSLIGHQPIPSTSLIGHQPIPSTGLTSLASFSLFSIHHLLNVK
ncbi:hypothetical protein DPEC_G00027090 [Dallia pectoralis]|uniref:Uncharacterized protein n=1 Tax=Dallia pectoralis TaxID=75939 RepID=A0ACC2HII5_DALPE|nr:hypothetical protein DPEC_G00027090 [Dallia pectoralis]